MRSTWSKENPPAWHALQKEIHWKPNGKSSWKTSTKYWNSWTFQVCISHALIKFHSRWNANFPGQFRENFFQQLVILALSHRNELGIENTYTYLQKRCHKKGINQNYMKRKRSSRSASVILLSFWMSPLFTNILMVYFYDFVSTS